ncbi:MAG: thioredoxin family protein [Kangiellaceae bacterium]|nr:thioredoxin family protein [Kangiellaceae bacterium]
MNYISVIISLMLLSLSACATSQTPEKTISNDAMGDISVVTLKQDYPGFFHHDDFQEQQTVIDKLANIQVPFTITTYFGTWCHDSKREVPRLLQLLEKANNHNISHTLIALDLSKTEPDGRAKLNGITNTPTFVVIKDGQEIGRIKEKPEATLGQDILAILESQ